MGKATGTGTSTTSLELPEAQLIYRNQENQSDSLPMDRSSDQDQTPSQRDRLEQFLPMTAAGKSALVEQKIINERTKCYFKKSAV